MKIYQLNKIKNKDESKKIFYFLNYYGHLRLHQYVYHINESLGLRIL